MRTLPLASNLIFPITFGTSEYVHECLRSPFLAPLWELFLYRAPVILVTFESGARPHKEGEVQPAIGHGTKSLRNCAEGMQKQPEGRHRAPRGAPGSTQDRPKGLLETPRIAKKACWRHPGHTPGNGSVPESSKAIFTSALYAFWTSILASFLCSTVGFRRLFISGFLHVLRGHS